jgi:sarcosine oxidase subunit gamma
MNAKLFDAQRLAISPVASATVVRGPIALADRSLWARAGVKGLSASAWLASRGANLPAINAAARQSDGSLLIRLAENEYASLAGASDSAGPPGGLPDFALDGNGEPGICPVPRFAANAWFTLDGDALPEMFAKLCGVDLRPHKFADHLVAQTIVARTAAILVRDDDAPGLRFHVLVDWTTAAYLWEALVDAMAEFESPANRSRSQAVPDIERRSM